VVKKHDSKDLKVLIQAELFPAYLLKCKKFRIQVRLNKVIIFLLFETDNVVAARNQHNKPTPAGAKTICKLVNEAKS
jgi:hypothetical protein